MKAVKKIQRKLDARVKDYNLTISKLKVGEEKGFKCPGSRKKSTKWR
jgi:hypothetical protein